MSGGHLGLFKGFGVELEYMIVRSDTLAVAPVADRLLRDATGEPSNEHDAGTIWWSNELVRHVIELKNPLPVAGLEALPVLFQKQVSAIARGLAPNGERLLPTGAHPFMDPHTETVLWQYENNEIYEAYDRIFSCTGHGWSNLQSTHLNLPFDGDEEFARLHTAIRLVLPLIPALCASTPILDGRYTGVCDSRLDVYRNNQNIVPSVGGHIIPEPVRSEQEYRDSILAPMYRDIAAHDPDGILRHEWLNSRGAIARFERSAVEIRIIDSQECSHADIAVCALISEVIRALVEQRWCSLDEQFRLSGEELERIFLDTIREGSAAVIDGAEYLKCLGVTSPPPSSARRLWRQLIGACIPESSLWYSHLNRIVNDGNLSDRIVKSTGPRLSHGSILKTYGLLAHCLSEGATFVPHQDTDNL